MNMDEEEKDVVLTVTWEYLPSIAPTFKAVQPYWFDIGGCGPSSLPAKEDSDFTYSSPTSKAPTSGLIAFAGGHLHNGGTHLDLLKQGDPCCRAVAAYKNEHIDQITACSNIPYSKGDEFSIVAYYNTSQHKPMTHHDGELEPVMGIAIIYAVEDQPTHHHKSNTLRNVVLAAIFGAILSMLACLMWLRYNRKSSRSVVPAWLRDRYKGNRIARDGSDHSHGRGERQYQTLLDHSELETDED
jgi:hypothetical protein